MTMTITKTDCEPEVFGLFPRAAELLQLKKDNRDGLYGEYQRWLAIYRADALKATEGETNAQIRGGKATRHILANCPVAISPQEVFATYGIIPHSDEDINNARKALESMPGCGATANHIALGYRTLIDKGIYGLLAEIDEKDAELDRFSTDEGVQRKITFYESLRLSLDGVLCYARRYMDEAWRLHSLETDPTRKFELERLAKALDRVPARPAETFFEALQSLLIYHFAMRIVTQEVNSIGRLDYMLGDFYERDLALGLVTRSEAAEWLQVPRIKSSIMTGQSDSIILAGSNPDGTPFWSDLTYFILDATKELNLQGPQVWFRYAPGQPRSLLRRALQPIRNGMAQPGFFNDEVAVKALTRSGIKEEHAYDFVSCQCVEISSQGRSNVLSGHAYHNLAKPLEALLNKGKYMVEDNKYHSWPIKDFPGHIPLEFDTFEGFFDAYEAYLRYLLQGDVEKSDRQLSSRPKVEFTMSSALLEGCIESGVSALDGGAMYNPTFPNYTGLVTAADSLAAIRQFVFDEKKATLEELAQMCRDNFAENEDARLYLLNRCPKYGNGDMRVDEIASRIFEIVDDELLRHRNVFGAKYAAQYFGWIIIDEQSYTLAATPDGRRHGETPSGTLGGDQGREKNGMTALFNSVNALDHTKAPGGMNVNLRISRSLLDKDSDVEKMIDFLLAYFQDGGMQVQINCISKEKLLDAQKHPEKYRDLAVRVSGQSLYFVELGRALQNQIISRTEHA